MIVKRLRKKTDDVDIDLIQSVSNLTQGNPNVSSDMFEKENMVLENSVENPIEINSYASSLATAYSSTMLPSNAHASGSSRVDDRKEENEKYEKIKRGSKLKLIKCHFYVLIMFCLLGILIAVYSFHVNSFDIFSQLDLSDKYGNNNWMPTKNLRSVKQVNPLNDIIDLNEHESNIERIYVDDGHEEEDGDENAGLKFILHLLKEVLYNLRILDTDSICIGLEDDDDGIAQANDILIQGFGSNRNINGETSEDLEVISIGKCGCDRMYESCEIGSVCSKNRCIQDCPFLHQSRNYGGWCKCSNDLECPRGYMCMNNLCGSIKNDPNFLKSVGFSKSQYDLRLLDLDQNLLDFIKNFLSKTREDNRRIADLNRKKCYKVIEKLKKIVTVNVTNEIGQIGTFLKKHNLDFSGKATDIIASTTGEEFFSAFSLSVNPGTATSSKNTPVNSKEETKNPDVMSKKPVMAEVDLEKDVCDENSPKFAIVFKFNSLQVEDVFFTIRTWNMPDYFPCKGNSKKEPNNGKGEKPDLIFHGSDESALIKAKSLFESWVRKQLDNKQSGFSCFKDVYFEGSSFNNNKKSLFYSKLLLNDDLCKINKDQIDSTKQMLNVKYSHIFWMSINTFAVRPGWLNMLEDEIEKMNNFGSWIHKGFNRFDEAHNPLELASDSFYDLRSCGFRYLYIEKNLFNDPESIWNRILLGMRDKNNGYHLNSIRHKLEISNILVPNEIRQTILKKSTYFDLIHNNPGDLCAPNIKSYLDKYPNVYFVHGWAFGALIQGSQCCSVFQEDGYSIMQEFSKRITTQYRCLYKDSQIFKARNQESILFLNNLGTMDQSQIFSIDQISKNSIKKD